MLVLGSAVVSDLRLGGDPVVAAYIGAFQIWPSGVRLSGHLAATSALSGAVGASRPFGGQAEAHSVLLGLLGRGRMVQGTIASASELGAAIGRRRPFSGAITSTTALVAGLRRKKPLLGAMLSLSAADGAILVDRTISGHVAGSSIGAGAIGARRTFGGTLAAASKIEGHLQVAGLVDVYGTLAATSIVQGRLSARRPVAGALASASVLAGTVGRRKAVAGTLASQSGAAATLGAHRGLSGSILSATVFTGAVGRLRPIAAALASSTALAGSSRRLRSLSASLASGASLSGEITVTPDVTLPLLLAQPGNASAFGAVANSYNQTFSIGAEAADRYVIAVAMVYRGGANPGVPVLSNPQIGGQPATLLYSQASSTAVGGMLVAFFGRLVPTGTTASMSFSLNANCNSYGGFYTIRDYVSTTPTATGFTPATPVASNTRNLNIPVEENGAVIAGIVNYNGSGLNWSGITERFASNASNLQWESAADTSATARTVTIQTTRTGSGTSHAMLAAIALR